MARLHPDNRPDPEHWTNPYPLPTTAEIDTRPPPPPRWQLDSTYEDSLKLKGLLRLGWEPFAIEPRDANDEPLQGDGVKEVLQWARDTIKAGNVQPD